MTRAMPLENVEWPEEAASALEYLAATEPTFTADDLRRLVSEPDNANEVGGAFQTARKAGLIRAVGFTESTAPSRRHSVIRVWQAVKAR